MRFFLLVAMLCVVPSALAATPGVNAELESASTTSPKEKTEFGRSAVDEIGGKVRTVEKLMEQAQKDKNVEHIDCLQRKLTPMRALLEVSKQSNVSMQSALSSAQVPKAEQEFRKIAVALTRSRDFAAEAQGCVGDSGVARGEPSYTVTESTEALAQTPDADIEMEGPRISQN
jgi:hypothetical protein